MKILYRPDIDGLRALSVIAVILYHANFQFNDQYLFRGGYIGVDIFFVISGYLITSLITKELNDTGGFNFVNFYLRRARRILPVLLLIILFFIPFAWFYLLPNSLTNFSSSIFFSTFFTSNFFFNNVGHDYGDALSITKPFLHTWSLSVEEQFYILYPLFFFCCFKFIKNKLLLLLILISLLSLALAEYGSINFSISNFYLLPTRIWEIFCGAILVVIKNNDNHKKFFKDLLSYIGLTLVLLSFYFFTDDTLHPSFKTIIPVFGTMLVIRFSNNNFIFKILSLKLFVYIGLISYSLYLWHYPIFSFSEMLGFDSSNINKCIFILISLFLSILSYFMIEKKFRNKRMISNRLFFFYLITSIFIISIFTFFIHKEKGYPNRAHLIFKKDFKEKPWESLRVDGEICHLRTKEFCNINSKGKNGSIFLVGDSHLITMGKPLSENLVKKDYNFISMTNGGCYFFPNFKYVNELTRKTLFGCDEKYQNNRLKLIKNAKNPTVIIGGNLNRYLSNTDVRGIRSPFIFVNNDNISIEENLINSIYDLLNSDIRVILIYPIPEIPWDPLNKIFLSSNSRNFDEVKKFISTNNVSTRFLDYKIRSIKSFELLNKITHKNVFKVFPHEVFCNKNNGKTCPVHNKDNIFYFDNEHLSITGATMLQKEVLKIINTFE